MKMHEKMFTHENQLELCLQCCTNNLTTLNHVRIPIPVILECQYQKKWSCTWSGVNYSSCNVPEGTRGEIVPATNETFFHLAIFQCARLECANRNVRRFLYRKIPNSSMLPAGKRQLRECLNPTEFMFLSSLGHEVYRKNAKLDFRLIYNEYEMMAVFGWKTALI